MKNWIVGILLSVLSVVGIASSEAVMKIIGGQGACDTTNTGCRPIPLTPTTLCTVSCAVEVSPSLVNASRFVGGSSRGVGVCRISIDGGVTWIACAAQPFTLGNREFYAEAADGSIIAVGSPTGPTTCTIRRSTDLGVNWSTVFTQAGGCTSGNLEGHRLFCLSDGRCEFLGSDSSTAQIFRSSDNGANWIAGESAVAANCGISGSVWDGSVGIFPSQAPGCGGGGIARTYLASSSDTWVQSAVWNGTQGDCWGQIIYNSIPRVICQSSGATPDGRYTIRDSVGANVQSLTIPNAGIAGTNAGGVAVSPFANTLYIMAQTSAGFLGTWVSRDGLGTFVQLASFSGGGAGIRGGNAFFANGCVYFAVGSTPMFGKIC